MAAITPEQRHELATLCERPRARGSVFSQDRPTDWRPHSILNPETGLPFTDASAFDLIATCLRSGHACDAIALRQPPGKTAFEMKITLPLSGFVIYVKLELLSGNVLGRSFHEDYRR